METNAAIRFQFHKGTIKTYQQCILSALVLHFNSIKVRLKPVVFVCCDVTSLFQFHKGTIKTRL